jgi:hypothetical protein
MGHAGMGSGCIDYDIAIERGRIADELKKIKP